MTIYEEEIVHTFNELCQEQGDGAAPFEVTQRMAKKGKLAAMDTVIDVERIMKKLRRDGRL